MGFLKVRGMQVLGSHTCRAADFNLSLPLTFVILIPALYQVKVLKKFQKEKIGCMTAMVHACLILIWKRLSIHLEQQAVST